MLVSILTHLIVGTCFFFAGARWGTIVIEWIKGPMSGRYLSAGQRWHLPGFGTVRLVAVWPESVMYFITKHGPDQTYVMNRNEFDSSARDENGRDPKGRFHKSIQERVLKFELRNGGRKDI